MTEAIIIGAFSTQFGKHIDKSYKDLVRESYEGVLADCGMPDGQAIEAAYFGNATMQAIGQSNVRGQMAFTQLVREGRFPERVPVTNVENACATSMSALASASQAIRSGDIDCALVVGVEKLFDEETGKGRLDVFSGALDQMNPSDWQAYFTSAGEQVGKPFVLEPNRTPFMDTYAMQAAWHCGSHGTTQEQFAIAAAKSHNFGADNPRAQYRFRLTPEEILKDREISWPLTRAMCAPMSDGAAALVVCSESFLTNLNLSTRDRAITIRAIEFAGGKYRDLDEPGLTHIAAHKAYARSNMRPADIDLAEVHDATSFSEIYQPEMLGFCDFGKGGAFVQDGHTHLGGKIPINTSGGLVSKGHPIGATGASMVTELVEQLRGEAGVRQVENARIALAENGGGVIGFDEAVAAVAIFERLEA